MRCITGAKYTMTATLLTVQDDYSPIDGGINIASDTGDGGWVESQDPLTGEIVNVWQPGTHEESDVIAPAAITTAVGDFSCVARGMPTSNRYGSTENFGDDYQNLDLVRLWVPANVRIKKSDRVYNIRKDGTTLWLDDDGSPVTFNVNGITPQFGPFNQHMETFVLLERTEV